MKTKMTIIRWGLPVLAALALVPVANAVTINYQVTQSGSVTSAAGLFGPDLHAAGTETWNQDLWTDHPNMTSGFLDSTGAAATGVGFSSDLGGPDDWNISAPLTLIHRSGRAFYNGPGNAGTFTITGLDNGTLYDLYIASAHLSGGGAAQGIGTWNTSNTNTTGATITIDNTGYTSNATGGTTWISGVNYVLFQNLQPSGGSITMTEHAYSPNLTDARVGFNGFQLISVPEPSTALLAGFGLLGLVRRRRA